MMEKYGVSDLKEQQEEELKRAKILLARLNASHEKTSSVEQEIDRLDIRVAELECAILAHSEENT